MKNTICWADIAVLDLDRAIKFYSAILNAPVHKIESEDAGGAFGMLPHESDNVAGCLSTERKPSDQGTLVYLDVGDFIDTALTLVPTFGGKVITPKQVMGPYGTRAIIQDCEGNVVALYQAPSA